MKRLTVFLLSVLFSLPGKGALLNLSQTPLAITSPVPPNVFFMLDDARTMDYEVMAAPLWDACAYDPNVTGSYSNNTTCGAYNYYQGQFSSYNGSSTAQIGYIFNNSDNVQGSGCGPSGNLVSCPQAATADWRILSSDANVNYYNPSISYQPWPGPCYSSGSTCTNASFTAALSNPVQGTTGNGLMKNLAGVTYSVWMDDHGWSGTRPLRAGSLNVTTGSNGVVDVWDSHIDIILNSSNAQVYLTTYNPSALSINSSSTLQASLSSSTACYNVLGPKSLVQSIFNGSLSYTSTDATGCKTLAQAQQNYANYYQYGRRRSMAAMNTLSTIIDQNPTYRFGYGNAHQTNPQWISVLPFPITSSTATQNNTILTDAYKTYYNNDTKVRYGLDSVGQYYSHNLPSVSDNPIACSTQRNIAILLTDGYWNDSFNAKYGDVDGDGLSLTLADVARYYYITNLQPTFNQNQVSPTSNDPATWLHMNTFIGAFGPIGYLVAGDNGWPTPSLQTSSSWGNPFNDAISQTDDLWHAAYNSAGLFFKMQDPTSVLPQIQSIVNIQGIQQNSSGQGVAQSSTVLNTSAQIYQGVYNSNNWTGDLLDYPISINGVLSTTPNWSADCILTGGTCTMPSGTNAGISSDNRVIITRNWSGANNGIAFRWPSDYTTYKVSGKLPTNLGYFLANAPYKSDTSNSSQISANQTYGQNLLDYLRGSRANEGSLFRTRTGVLGDIVNSVPDYVGPPNRVFPDNLEASSYSTFKATYANRTPIVYVGANDGMLHGFNANTGQEVLAYIPGANQIYQNLPNISSTSYSHNFFVDGSPTDADVYFNNAWHTILVGSLRNGGQGVYALDITDPSKFSEANASNIYLWEFTDQDDPDLGYIEGPISVAKVRTGSGQSQWAVIFGNGYNSTQSDNYTSTTGQAALYILLLGQFNGTWTLNSNYYKFLVGSGTVKKPSGLGPPGIAALNQNYIADYVYAGSLNGNLWRFDLTSSTPANWTSNILFNAYYATSSDQPITAQPVVGPHPTGLQNGVLVYFGTGQFLQATDNSATNQTTQSFYAIWDKLTSTATVAKSQLVQQQILGEVNATTGTYRAVSSNSINWNMGTSQNLGWYINFIENGASSNMGERVVSEGILRNGNVIFPTILPSGDPCAAGGSSFLMELNAASGGAPSPTPFDVNGDGYFSSADYITVNANGASTNTTAAGIKSTVGMLGIPAILLSPTKTFETKVLTGTNGLSTLKENTQGIMGRQNWRQVY